MAGKVTTEGYLEIAMHAILTLFRIASADPALSIFTQAGIASHVPAGARKPNTEKVHAACL
ncbi:MAG: hypothetical protein ACYDDO_06690 [Acidiferrobacterales bacterium]